MSWCFLYLCVSFTFVMSWCLLYFCDELVFPCGCPHVSLAQVSYQSDFKMPAAAGPATSEETDTKKRIQELQQLAAVLGEQVNEKNQLLTTLQRAQEMFDAYVWGDSAYV